jgi:hypothetical protein
VRTITLIALLATVGVALVAGAGSVGIDRQVLGGGGGRVASGVYRLDATVGQPVAGTVSSADDALCAGYWCAPEVRYLVYLPGVRRPLP